MNELQLALLSRLSQAPLELIVNLDGPDASDFSRLVKDSSILIDEYGRMCAGAPTSLKHSTIQFSIERLAERARVYAKIFRRMASSKKFYVASAAHQASINHAIEILDGPWHEYYRKGIGERTLSRTDAPAIRMDINTGLLAPVQAYPPSVMAPWGEVNKYLVRNLGINQ